MHLSIAPPRPRLAALSTPAATAEAFSPREILSTLRALAGAAVDFERAHTCLCQQQPPDWAAIAHAQRCTAQAHQALTLHCRRLVPRIRPGMTTAAADRFAAWLLREAEAGLGDDAAVASQLPH